MLSLNLNGCHKGIVRSYLVVLHLVYAIDTKLVYLQHRPRWWGMLRRRGKKLIPVGLLGVGLFYRIV